MRVPLPRDPLTLITDLTSQQVRTFVNTSIAAPPGPVPVILLNGSHAIPDSTLTWLAHGLFNLVSVGDGLCLFLWSAGDGLCVAVSWGRFTCRWSTGESLCFGGQLEIVYVGGELKVGLCQNIIDTCRHNVLTYVTIMYFYITDSGCDTQDISKLLWRWSYQIGGQWYKKLMEQATQRRWVYKC